MKYMILNAKKCELFKKAMAQTGWEITHQDVGQTEILAYGYVIIWEKDDKKVMLNYEDRQGQERAGLEISINAGTEIDELVATL